MTHLISVRRFHRGIRRCAAVWLLGALLPGSGPALAQCEMAKLLASDGQAIDRFGFRVSVYNDRAIVGTSPSNEIGAAYIYRFDGLNWVEEAKLTAADGQPGDRFGAAVAVRYTWAIVGATGCDDKGAAYVFHYDGAQWVQQQKLWASDGAVGDGFGRAVAIDGSTAVITAPGDGAGSAYVFHRTSLAWWEQDKIEPVDGEEGDWFGWSCAVHAGDVGVAVIGTFWDDDAGMAAGSAYVFRRDGGDWNQEDKLIGADVGAWDRFGCSVGVSGDVAVVGSDFDYDLAGDGVREPGDGYAYVFRFNGATWDEELKLVPSDLGPDDYFGSAVAISGDTIVAGAKCDDNNGIDSGSAYIFRHDGATWIEDARLLASDGAMNDRFGWSVAIKGERMIAGAVDDGDNGEGSGSAYVFDLADHDCNHNGVCDAVDILGGTSEDCNANGIPDECDVVEVWTFDSGHLSPIGTGYPQDYTIPAPHEAAGDMRLFFTAISDLYSTNHYILVRLNGTDVGEVFRDGAWDCPDLPDEDHLVIDKDLVNQLIAGGQDAVFMMVAMGGIDPEACEWENYIAVTIEHTVHGENDVNRNGVPDECECTGDANGDGTVNVLDILAVLAVWNLTGVPADVNFDGVVNVLDLLVVLGAWGPC